MDSYHHELVVIGTLGDTIVFEGFDKGKGKAYILTADYNKNGILSVDFTKRDAKMGNVVGIYDMNKTISWENGMVWNKIQ